MLAQGLGIGIKVHGAVVRLQCYRGARRQLAVFGMRCHVLPCLTDIRIEETIQTGMHTGSILQEVFERRSNKYRRLCLYLERIRLAPCAGTGTLGIGTPETPVPCAGIQRPVEVIHTSVLRLADFGIFEIFRPRKGILEPFARLHGLRDKERSGIDNQFVRCLGIRLGALFVLVRIGIGRFGLRNGRLRLYCLIGTGRASQPTYRQGKHRHIAPERQEVFFHCMMFIEC